MSRKILVKDWIVRSKEFSSGVMYAINVTGCHCKNFYITDLINETEKAYFVKIDTDFGIIKFYAPKSQCDEIIDIDGKEYIKSIYLKNQETQAQRN